MEKTYREWIVEDDAVKSEAKEKGLSYNAMLKAIAREKGRDEDAFVSTFKSSVSRARRKLGLLEASKKKKGK